MKLRQLGSGLRVVSTSIAPATLTEVERDQQRAGQQLWRAWYGLQRWKDLRLRIWRRDHFTCRRCGFVGRPGSGQLACDHVRGHDNGNPTLFWDEANLQTLCKVCHDKDKQREDLDRKRQRY